jgi:hypothetical protein
MRAKYVVVGVVVGLLLSSAAIVVAGNLDPPSGPGDPLSQMYTLEQIYDRLDTGAIASKMSSFTEPDAGPGATGHTLDEVMDLAAAVGDPDPPCWDNTNRYVDCGNGTVHDQVTNLIWLQHASCLGHPDYAAANNAAAGLEDGECGLTDGSSPGDWRLPTKEEWEATVAYAVAEGCTGDHSPSLMDTPGSGCYQSGTAKIFTGVFSAVYWSSETSDFMPLTAWAVSLGSGDLGNHTRTSLAIFAWPVRAGK